jgi:hypothetical protein
LRREPALATRLIDRGKIGVLRAIRQGDVDDPFSLVDQQQFLACRGDETLGCDVAIGRESGRDQLISGMEVVL